MFSRERRGAIRRGATRDAAARTSHDRGKIISGPSFWALFRNLGVIGRKERGLLSVAAPRVRRRVGMNWGHGPPHIADKYSLYLRLCQVLFCLFIALYQSERHPA